MRKPSLGALGKSPIAKITSRQRPVFLATDEKVKNGHELINRGNRILILFHLYCCSTRKLSTILSADLANLTRFVTLTF